MTIKIGIIGAAGRMGQVLIDTIVAGDVFSLSGAGVRTGSPLAGTPVPIDMTPPVQYSDKLTEIFQASDVVIDFSTAGSTTTNIEMAQKTKTPLIIGTTAIDAETIASLSSHANESPILYAPNMSLGINLLFALAEKAAKALDNEYEIEIYEEHHSGKIDAPSGTALAIGRIVADANNLDFDAVKKFSNADEDLPSPAKPDEILLSYGRTSEVTGDHILSFANKDEILSISHHAKNRSLFAKGALKAALWIKGRPAGLYSMKDVLGL